MTLIIVEVPYRNVSRHELIIDAMDRVFSSRSRAECEAYFAEQLALGTVTEFGEVPSGNSSQMLRITLEIDSADLETARQNTLANIADLDPEVRSLLFGDGEASGEIADGDIDDYNRAIDLASRMTPEERQALLSGGNRPRTRGSAARFANALERYARELREHAQATLSDTQVFDPAPAVTSQAEERLEAINLLLESEIASEGIRAELLAERDRLRASVDARVASAEALPLPEVPRLTPEDPLVRRVLDQFPLAGEAMTAAQIVQGQMGFVNGLVRGYATEMPEGGHEVTPFDEPGDYAEAYAGYLLGIAEGVAEGIAGLVSAVAGLVRILFNNSPLGISIDLIDEGWDGYYNRRRDEISSAMDLAARILLACRQLETEFRNNPAQVGAELGGVLGRVSAQQVDAFLDELPFEQGRVVGNVVGIVLLEVASDILMTAATGGAAPAARAGATALRVVDVSSDGARYVGTVRRLVQNAPVIQRFLRRLGRVENVTDAVPSPGPGVLDNAGDALRRAPDAPPGRTVADDAPPGRTPDVPDTPPPHSVADDAPSGDGPPGGTVADDAPSGEAPPGSTGAGDAPPGGGGPPDAPSSPPPGDGSPPVPRETPEEFAARAERMEDAMAIARAEFERHGRAGDVPSASEISRVAEHARRFGLDANEIEDLMDLWGNSPQLGVEDIIRQIPSRAPVQVADTAGSTIRQSSAVQRQTTPVMPEGNAFPDGTLFNDGSGARSMPAPASVMDDETRRVLRGHGAPSVSEEIAGTGGIHRIEARPVAGTDDGQMIVAIEGEILPGRLERGSGALDAGQTRAPNYNSAGPSTQPTMNALGFAEPGDWERLHLWGPGFGDEAAAGMYAGPRELNQAWQNRGVEDLIRELGRQVAPHRGDGFRLRCRAQVQTWGNPTPGGFQTSNGELLVREVRYDVMLDMPDGTTRTARVELVVGNDPGLINAGQRPAIDVGLDENAFRTLFDGLPP